MKNLVKLGELTIIKTGKLDANASTPNGAYPFFTCAIKPLKISSYSYDCECVLVAGNGDLNVKYYCGKFDAYQRTYIIEVKNKEKLLTKYLYYFLQLYISLLRSQSIGGVIKYIKLNNLTDLQINVPLLSEQQEIVSLMERTSALMAKHQQQLEKLDLLIKARFYEMFGNGFYEKTPIYALVDTKIESAKKRYSLTDRIRYIDISSIDNRQNIMMGFAEYTFADAPSRAHQCLKQYDILVSTVRPNLRNIAMNCYAYNNLVASSGFCLLRAKACNAKYLFAAILLDDFSREMSELTTGANYPAIKDSDVLSYQIPNPPIELQNEFARFVEQTENIKSKIKQSLEKLEILKQSLLQKYFG